jgi:hypothetical protein
MTREELIILGKSMVAKGRSPRSIHEALRNNAPDKETLNAALEAVFAIAATPKFRSKQHLNELLQARRTKTSLDYARKFLPRLGLLILALGIATALLSNARVNQNGIFAWITIGQALVLIPFFWIIQSDQKDYLLLPAFLFFIATWLGEILLFGMPNDLIKAYYDPGIRVVHAPAKGTAIARLIGFLYPFVYMFLKAVFATLIYNAHRKFKIYAALDEATKREIENL